MPPTPTTIPQKTSLTTGSCSQRTAATESPSSPSTTSATTSPTTALLVASSTTTAAAANGAVFHANHSNHHHRANSRNCNRPLSPSSSSSSSSPLPSTRKSSLLTVATTAAGGAATGGGISTPLRMWTIQTPFFQWAPDHDHDDKNNHHDSSGTAHRKQQQRQQWTAIMMSQSPTLSDASSQQQQQDDSFSTTEGIDVLGAEPSPTNFCQWSHQRTGRIVTSPAYKRACLALILACSLLLGFRCTHFVQREHRANLLPILNYIIQACLWFFTTELIIDIVHYQRKTFQMGWVVFDAVIVATSWFVSTNLLVLRAFRLIRALRKASGLLHLKYTVKAVLRALPKILAVSFLMALMLYIYAVLFTAFFQDLYGAGQLTDDYFGTLSQSALTLFQIMTMGRLWSEVADDVMQVYPASWMLWVSFVSTSTLVFGALFVAVTAEAVSTVSHERIWRSLELQGSKSHSHHGTGAGAGDGDHAARLANASVYLPPPPLVSGPIVTNINNTTSGNIPTIKEFQALVQTVDALSIQMGQLLRLQKQILLFHQQQQQQHYQQQQGQLEVTATAPPQTSMDMLRSRSSK